MEGAVEDDQIDGGEVGAGGEVRRRRGLGTGGRAGGGAIYRQRYGPAEGEDGTGEGHALFLFEVAQAARVPVISRQKPPNGEQSFIAVKVRRHALKGDVQKPSSRKLWGFCSPIRRSELRLAFPEQTVRIEHQSQADEYVALADVAGIYVIVLVAVEW